MILKILIFVVKNDHRLSQCKNMKIISKLSNLFYLTKLKDNVLAIKSMKITVIHCWTICLSVIFVMLTSYLNFITQQCIYQVQLSSH